MKNSINLSILFCILILISCKERQNSHDNKKEILKEEITDSIKTNNTKTSTNSIISLTNSRELKGDGLILKANDSLNELKWRFYLENDKIIWVIPDSFNNKSINFSYVKDSYTMSWKKINPGYIYEIDAGRLYLIWENTSFSFVGSSLICRTRPFINSINNVKIKSVSSYTYYQDENSGIKVAKVSEISHPKTDLSFLLDTEIEIQISNYKDGEVYTGLLEVKSEEKKPSFKFRLNVIVST